MLLPNILEKEESVSVMKDKDLILKEERFEIGWSVKLSIDERCYKVW